MPVRSPSVVSRRAQLVLLARLLHTTPGELDSLERLDASDLTDLRQRISGFLSDDMACALEKMNRLLSRVPARLVAMTVLAVVPPDVAGRGYGALGPAGVHRASAVIRSLTPQYLADAAPFVDPRMIAAISDCIDGSDLLPVARELLRRKDFVTAAMFVDNMSVPLIQEPIDQVEADRSVVRASGSHGWLPRRIAETATRAD